MSLVQWFRGGGGKFQIDVNEEGVCGDNILPERVYCSVAQFLRVINALKIWTIITNMLPFYHKKTTDEFLIIHEPLS